MTPEQIAHLTLDEIICIAATYQHRPLTDAVIAALAVSSVAVDKGQTKKRRTMLRAEPTP